MDGVNNILIQAPKKDGIVSEINKTQSLAVFFCNIQILRGIPLYQRVLQ